MSEKRKSKDDELQAAWKRMRLAPLLKSDLRLVKTRFQTWQIKFIPSKSQIDQKALKIHQQLHRLQCEQEVSNMPQKLTTVWKTLGLKNPFPATEALSESQQQIRISILIAFEEFQLRRMPEDGWTDAVALWQQVCDEARSWHRRCRASLDSLYGPCLVHLSELEQMTRLLHAPTVITEPDLAVLMSRFSVPKDSEPDKYNFTSFAGGKFMIPEQEWIKIAAECKLHAERGLPVARLNQQLKDMDTSRFLVDFDIRRPLPPHKSFTTQQAIRKQVPFVSIFTRDNVARRSILEVMAATIRRCVIPPAAEEEKDCDDEDEEGNARIDEAVVLCASGPIATFEGEYVAPPRKNKSGGPQNWPATAELEAKDSFSVVFPNLVLGREESQVLALAIRLDLERRFLRFGEAPDMQIYTQAKQRRLLYSDKKAIEVCSVHWAAGQLPIRCRKCKSAYATLATGCPKCKEQGVAELSCKECKWKGHQWRPLRFMAWFRSVRRSALADPRAMVLRPDPAIEWTDAFDKTLRRAVPGMPVASLIGTLVSIGPSLTPASIRKGQKRLSLPPIHNSLFRFFPEGWEPDIVKTRDMQSIALDLDFNNPYRIKLDQTNKQSAMGTVFEAVNHTIKNYLGPSCLCTELSMFWTDKGIPMYQMGMIQNMQHFSLCPHKQRVRKRAMAKLEWEAQQRNVVIEDLYQSRDKTVQALVTDTKFLLRHKTQRTIVTLTPTALRFRCMDSECTKQAKTLLGDKFDSFEVRLPPALQQVLFVSREDVCKVIDSGRSLTRFLALGAMPFVDKLKNMPIQSVWE